MNAARMEHVRRVALALVVVAGATPALAQTTGALSGRVVDRNSGAPLPGAAVSVSGDGLQGSRSALSDAQGELVLPLLPPGAYDLAVEHRGYQGFTRSVTVPLGQTVRVRLELFADGGQLTFATEPQPSVIAQTEETGGRVTADQLALVPYGRNVRTFIDALSAVPGVEDLPILDAASRSSFRIDGLRVTSPADGAAPFFLVQNFVQEIEVRRAGYRAEDGFTGGGLVDVATPSGSNALHGASFADVSPFEASGASRPRKWALEAGAELGGALVRDRLWFHAGFAPLSVDSSGATSTSYQYQGKLTWAIDSRQTLSLSSFGDALAGPGGVTGGVRYLASLLDDTLLVDAVAGAHGRSQAQRLEGAVKLTSLIARHRIKYGLEAERDSASLENGALGLAAAFVQDSWRVLEVLVLDGGLRVEQRSGRTDLLPRAGAVFDFSGRGVSRAFASWGLVSPTMLAQRLNPAAPVPQVTAGIEHQVYRDLALGLEVEHTEPDGRHYNAVTLLAHKPFSENYLFTASYTRASLDVADAFKLDLAYVYEVDARTSVSLGAAGRLFKPASGWTGEVDLRLAGSRKLNQDFTLAANIDLFNLTNTQALLPSGLQQLPLSLRAGSSLSF